MPKGKIYLDVLISDSGGRVFTYSLESSPAVFCQKGDYVLVPLRGRKSQLGIVMKLYPDGFNCSFKTKSIIKVLKDKRPLDTIAFELAEEIARHSFCSYTEALELFINPLSPSKTFIDMVSLCPDYNASSIKETQRARLRVVENLLACSAAQGMPRLKLQEIANVPLSTINKMAELGIVEIKAKGKFDIIEQKKCKVSELTEAQDKIYNEFNKSRENDLLLYGVTGSGKTEIYFKIIEDVLKAGKNAVFLVPEISLTPQMTKRIIDRFGEKIVAVIHSKVSEGIKAEQLEGIVSGRVRIVLGARSAIFSPLRNIGIIIIDECHESSFSSGKRPRYDTILIARKLANLMGAKLLLGSATPDIVDYYNYKSEGSLLSLDTRFKGYTLPKALAVDMRHESDKIVSAVLDHEIKNRLQNGEQTILFINKKGYSSISVCGNCGHNFDCPNCDIPLTYYKNSNRLVCSYCGHIKNAPSICPNCKSDKIMYYGQGTEKIELEIKKRYNARVARLDRSIVTSTERLNSILKDFEDGKIDILVGTQIVAKGLDFPNVSLIGIMNADMQLRMPTYLASERAYQLFTQVSGRAGRTGLKSQVLLQTYNPEHFVVKALDYSDFYHKELAFRMKMGYPPFRQLILMTFTDNVEARALQSAKRSSDYINKKLIKQNIQKNVKIMQVMPALIKRVDNNYRYQLLLIVDNSVFMRVSEFVSILESKLKKAKLSTITIDIGGKRNGN